VYVCVCNAYRESQVRDVIQKSAASPQMTVEEIYSRLGNGPRCGRCLPHAKDLINRVQEKTPALTYSN
jgi:bacterioferritin-associated ferredoxin